MNLSIKLNLPDALKQTLLFGTSIAIMKGVSLLMLPFIAHHLSAESFGRLEVITTLAVIGSILVGMGLEDTLFRFAGVLKDMNQRKCLAAEIFSLTLIIGSVAWLISWFVAETVAAWMPGNPTVYEVRLVLSILALEGCIAIPLGWLRMCNRAHTFFFVTTGRALLQAIVVVIQLSLDRGVEGILEAGLIAALAQVMVLDVCIFVTPDCGLAVKRGLVRSSTACPLSVVVWWHLPLMDWIAGFLRTTPL